MAEAMRRDAARLLKLAAEAEAEAQDMKELLRPVTGAWQPEFWAGPTADSRFTEFQAIREGALAGCADQLLALAGEMRSKAARLLKLANTMASPEAD